MKIIEKEEISCGKIWMSSEGIIHLVYKPKTILYLHEAKEITKATNELASGVKVPVFADARFLQNVTREARIYLASEEATECILAIGTIDKPIIRVIARIFLSMNKPPYPIRYFASEWDALAWLKEYL